MQGYTMLFIALVIYITNARLASSSFPSSRTTSRSACVWAKSLAGLAGRDLVDRDRHAHCAGTFSLGIALVTGATFVQRPFPFFLCFRLGVINTDGLLAWMANLEIDVFDFDFSPASCSTESKGQTVVLLRAGGTRDSLESLVFSTWLRERLSSWRFFRGFS